MERREGHSGHPARRKMRFLLSMLVFFLILSLLFGVPFSLQAQETVDPRSGRLLSTVTDLIVAAGPVNIEVRRALQPDRAGSGLLGAKWRLSFEKRLIKETKLIQIQEETGPLFFSQEGNQPEYRNGLGGKIRLEKNGRAVWQKKDGTRETFDGEGRLVEIDCRNFNKVNLVYGADKRLLRIDGPRKHFLKFNLDGHGRITRIESSNSDIITCQYTNDNLSQVQVNGAAPIRYEYNANGYLTRIEDPRSGIVEIIYDAKGRVLSRRFADGGKEQHTYQNDDKEHQIIDPMGGVTKRKWSADGGREEVTDPLGHKTLIENNALGLPLSITDPLGNKSQITYDSQGRMISLKNGTGRATRFEYLKDTGLLSRIIRSDGSKQVNQYEGEMNLTEVRRGPQTIFQQTYHPDGTIKSIKELGKPEERFTYDPAGRLLTQGNALGHQTRFEYDQQGNLIRKINPLGGVTLFKYDNQKQIVSITDPVKTTTQYEYNSQGLLSQEIDPGGRVTCYGYDARGRLLTVTDPSGGALRNEYDLEGRIVRKIFPGGQAARFSYDSAGNLVRETNILGQTKRFTRDPLGRIVKETTAAGQEIYYEYDPLDNLISWKDNLGSGENLKYNLDGQLIERVTRQGTSTRFTYDSAGNLTSATDSLGKMRRFAYTPTGELSEAAEPDGSISRYTYDSAGHLSTIKHPGGGESRFFYDPMGNLIGTTNPLWQTIKRTYDQTGRLLAQTDAKGQTVRFIYNALGQLVEKQLPDKIKVTYQYDPSGNLIQADDGQFPIRFSYNPSGILNRVEYPAMKKNLLYTYDTEGLLKTLKDSDGNQIGYHYNDLKQLVTIVLPDLKKIGFSYTPNNLLRSISYPNGITGRWEYDTADRIIKIRYQDNAGKLIAGWNYVYDPAGNVIQQKDIRGQPSFFKYDPAGQLIEETSPNKKIQYRYGPGGNRSSVEENGVIRRYQHDTGDRVIKAGEENFFYDGNGNLINRKGPKAQTTYEYNAENRLIKVSRSDGETTSFGYAPTGERVWRRDHQGQTFYLYDGYNLIQETEEKGNPKVTYVYGPGIDRPLAMLRDGQWYFYHPDRLGSIKVLTDSQGKIAVAYDYDAFGKIRSQQGSISNPFTYTGREREQGEGLYYYRARHYDPNIGRFLSPDAMPPNLGKPFSLNPYLYTRNNPVRFTDPLGLDWWEPIKNAGIWNTPEECLEYWRMIKSRPDNPNHDMADQMIQRTEEYIREQGRAVPPPPNPAPTGGGENLGNRPGGSTIKVGQGSPKPSDTLSVKPGATPAPAPGPGGITRPGFYGAVGNTLGVVGAAVNLKACLDEGNSKAWCFGQLGLGVAVGAGVGAILAPVVAAGGTAATVIAVGGAAFTGATAYLAGDRWSRAPETRAQLEQQAAQQGQQEARIKNALANLEGKIGDLNRLGKEFCDAQSKANDSALKAKAAAEKARKNIESTMGSLNSEVTGSLMNDCIQNQEKLKDLPDKISKADEWLGKAARGYEEAINKLSLCFSQKDISDADEFLKAATAMGLSGERKTREALADIDALKSDIPKIKDRVKEIQNKMNNLENGYLASQQEVDSYVSDTDTRAKVAEGKIAQFNGAKADLSRSVSNLRAAVPGKFQWDLDRLNSKINNAIPPCSVKSQDESRNIAKAAKESISVGLPSGLSGLGDMISMGSLAVQKVAIDSALNTCGNLNPPSGREADNISLALVKLTNNLTGWLKTIADLRGLCQAKLYAKPPVPVPPKPPQTTTPDTPPPPKPGTGGPVIPPPPPAIKKLNTLAADCYPNQVSIGDTVQCTAIGVYEGDSPTDVTNQVTWTPYTSRFTILRKPESGIISVAYSLQGISGTVSVRVVDKTGSDGPVIPPPPPPPPSPPPGPKKLVIFAWECYPKDQVMVGGSVQCQATGVFEGEEPRDITAQATWSPGANFTAPSVKPESGYITVTVEYWGERGAKLIKVVDAGYDPRNDPGIPGRDKPVDPEQIKEPMAGFGAGPGQGTRPDKPQQPQTPIPIPTDYTRPPDQPQKPPDQPGTLPPVQPGGNTPPTPTQPSTGGDSIAGFTKPQSPQPQPIKPPKPPQPPKPPTGGGTTSQKYAVFLVKGVFGGAGYSVVVCEVSSTFLKGKQYQKKSKDFNTKEEADKAYCDALQSNPRSIPLTGGSKAKIYGGDYWVGDATPACPKKP